MKPTDPFRPLYWIAALGLMVCAFALYLQPGFLVLLAEQVWACF